VGRQGNAEGQAPPKKYLEARRSLSIKKIKGGKKTAAREEVPEKWRGGGAGT